MIRWIRKRVFLQDITTVSWTIVKIVTLIIVKVALYSSVDILYPSDLSIDYYPLVNNDKKNGRWNLSRKDLAPYINNELLAPEEWRSKNSPHGREGTILFTAIRGSFTYRQELRNFWGASLTIRRDSFSSLIVFYTHAKWLLLPPLSRKSKPCACSSA